MPDPQPKELNGGYVPWRIYERDRARDNADRQDRRRELDNVFRDIRREMREMRESDERLTAAVREMRQREEAEDNQRAGKVAVGRAVWIYILGGLLMLTSIASGIVTIVVAATGGP